MYGVLELVKGGTRTEGVLELVNVGGTRTGKSRGTRTGKCRGY